MENEQPHNDEGGPERAVEPTSPESRSDTTPRVYVASLADYAEELVAGCGLIKEDLLTDHFAGYVFIDYEGIARDMELSGDVTTSEGDGGVYVFEGHR